VRVGKTGGKRDNGPLVWQVAQKGLDVLLRLNNEGKGQKIKLLAAAALNNLSAHPANATAMYRAELGTKAERAMSSAQKHKRGLQAELQSSLLKPQRSLWRRVAFDSYGLFKPERGSQLALWQPRVERYEASVSSELDLLGDSHYNSPLAYSNGSKHRERLSVPHMVGRSSEPPRPDPIRHAASSRPFRPEPFCPSWIRLQAGDGALTVSKWSLEEPDSQCPSTPTRSLKGTLSITTKMTEER